MLDNEDFYLGCWIGIILLKLVGLGVVLSSFYLVEGGNFMRHIILDQIKYDNTRNI